MIEVLGAAFSDALAVVSPLLDVRAGLRVSQTTDGFALEGRTDRADIYLPVCAKRDAFEAFTIQPGTLKRVLDAGKEELWRVSVDKKQLGLKSKAGSLKLPLLESDAEDWRTPAPTLWSELQVIQWDDLSRLETVLKSAALSSATWMSALHLTPSSGTTLAFVTDGFRVHTLKLETVFPEAISVAGSAVTHLLRFARAINQARVAVHAGRLWLESEDGKRGSFALSSAKPPSFGKITDAVATESFQVQRKALARGVALGDGFTNEETRAVKLVVKGSGLRLEFDGRGIGELEQTVEIQNPDGVNLKAQYRSTSLSGALSNAGDAEWMTVEVVYIVQGQAALRFLDGAFTAIIQPIQK